MGQKIMLVSMVFSAMAVLGSFICLFLAWHKMTYFIAGGFKALRMETYTLKIYINVKQNEVCNFVDNEWCEKVKAATDLEDAKQRWCSDIAVRVFPNFCPGVTGAYYLGTVMIIMVIINAIMNGISVYLMYHYITFSAKKNYRLTAVILQVVGALLIWIILVLYYPLVLVYLDSNRARHGLNLVLSPSSATGVARGYIFMWLVVLVQCVSVGISQFGKVSDEARVKEEREIRQFEAEMAMYGGGDHQPNYSASGHGSSSDPYGGAYGTNPHAGYGGAYGTNPYAGQSGAYGTNPHAGQNGAYGTNPQAGFGGTYGTNPHGSYGGYNVGGFGGAYGTNPQASVPFGAYGGAYQPTYQPSGGFGYGQTRPQQGFGIGMGPPQSQWGR